MGMIVRACDKEIGNVTGILRAGQHPTAEVYFEVKYTNHTPFGRWLAGGCPSASTGRAGFMLYDDGWRVQWVNW